MTETANIVIVGGGLEGLAAAWSLAERGETDVLVLERGTMCSGMTGKSSGIVRCHYGVPSLAAMAWHGVQVFSEAEEIFGADIGFRQTGYVVGVGPQNTAPLAANVEMHRALGVPVETIDAGEVRRLLPGIALDPFAAFAYEPLGGHGDAYMTGMAYGTRARALGVRVRQGTPRRLPPAARGRRGLRGAARGRLRNPRGHRRARNRRVVTGTRRDRRRGPPDPGPAGTTPARRPGRTHPPTSPPSPTW